MRKIKYIAVHCTATSQRTSISAIQSYWKNQLGWKMPGYHFIILPNGEVVQLLNVELVSNGVKGYNSNLINIAYIGGVNDKNEPIDNRTIEQKASILKLLKELKKQYKTAKIQGHRDFPKVNKACPSFDAKKEYENV
ncbi:N-acetylmuramoyl-L-alanine amidase [Flavobacterium jejuense]|uniref:N-acetylmuramoyl-L-alanine amidase n=1 Tax=Flavobacterium jejuense TaxID=1544455 RepID=A0ABX0ISL7_9FLAO|nr:N-acetylmuramoyl-L-alanine amidase [Flavobacterium jejuense]NHN26762.1 N-acetylmuramoyl-L-alanine amidase [Flavobacterium jejuense]